MATQIDPLEDQVARPSRRRLVRTAVKLALAAPLALAVLPGVAAAKDHDDGDDDGDDRRRGRALGLNCAPNTTNNNNQFNGAMSGLPLVGVASASTGGDFAATSGGSDALTAGEVFVNSAKQVLVALRGAVPNAGYDVQFVRLHDDGREDLGTITTDTNGNFNGNAPNALGSGNRVGAFVLIRGGSDEYVSAWP